MKKKKIIIPIFTLFLFIIGCSVSNIKAVNIAESKSHKKTVYEKFYKDSDLNIPVICRNLSEPEKQECINEVNSSLASITYYPDNSNGLTYWNNCYQKGSSDEIVRNEKNSFKKYILEGDYSNIFMTYFNFGMCHWSSNDFEAAKYYIDNFDLLIPIAHVAGNGGFISGSGRLLPDDEIGNRWIVGHQFVRFIENVLRTKHRYLCNNKPCLELAWSMTQMVLSNKFLEELIHTAIANDNNTDELMKLFFQRKKLHAQENLLLLASKEKILPKAEFWASQIREQREKLSAILHKEVPTVRSLENNNTIDIERTKKMLKRDEIILSYLFSIECRNPIIWSIGNNSVQFKIASMKKSGCTTEIVKQKINEIRQSIIYLNDTENIKNLLIWFRELLIDPIKLPKPGSKLLIIVDESMSGLPFELLPLKSGQLLGEAYRITYTPSVPVFARLRENNPDGLHKIIYTGISKDKHSYGASQLNVNSFIELLSQFYNGTAIKEAEEKTIYESKPCIENSKYVHFITHSAIIDGRHGLFYGASSHEDGLLTGEEISTRLRFKADTVIITSCDSAGISANLDPGESFSSLPIGVLSAGAKRIILTRWPIQERVAQVFSENYLKFREKEGLSPEKSMQKARDIIKNTFNNPSAYAAWMLIGD